jgi:hypothetical protein
VENELVKKLMWVGLQAGLGALSGLIVQRVAVLVWWRAFGEEPPE